MTICSCLASLPDCMSQEGRGHLNWCSSPCVHSSCVHMLSWKRYPVSIYWIYKWMNGWQNGWIETLREKVKTFCRASPLQVRCEFKGSYVNLKNQAVHYFWSKIGLFGDNRETQFKTSKPCQSHRPVQHTKERKVILWRRGRKLGGIVLKSLLEESKSSGWWWLLIGWVAGVVDFL